MKNEEQKAAALALFNKMMEFIHNCVTKHRGQWHKNDFLSVGEITEIRAALQPSQPKGEDAGDDEYLKILEHPAITMKALPTPELIDEFIVIHRNAIRRAVEFAYNVTGKDVETYIADRVDDRLRAALQPSQPKGDDVIEHVAYHIDFMISRDNYYKPEDIAKSAIRAYKAIQHTSQPQKCTACDGFILALEEIAESHDSPLNDEVAREALKAQKQRTGGE